MTQEEKDLLFQDLSARLPYKVKVQSTFYNCDGSVWKYENETLTPGLLEYEITRYKPYLFPMSSMTKEQKKYIRDNHTFGATYELFDWLNKNHFDYRGLIEKDLAIDATGLNIY